MVTKNTDNSNSPRIANVTWLLPVLNNRNTPPTTPKDGDRYRVTSVASGAWTGKEDYIAIYDQDALGWVFEHLEEAQIWYDYTSQNWHYFANGHVLTQFDKIPLAESDVTGLVADLASKAPLVHKANHVVGGSDAFVAGDNLDATAKNGVKVNSGALVANRRIHNFIAGTNVSITAVDNSGGESVDITFNNTSSVVTSFDDSLFNVFNHADNTKKITLDASLITTGQTRNYKFPDVTNKTLSFIDNAETFSATKTSSVNGDVLIPSVDGQGNVGNNSKRFALVRAVLVSSGDVILCDRKTGKTLYVIHEDKSGIYFSDYKTGKTKMCLNMKNGNLKIAGKLIQNAKFAKKYIKPKVKKAQVSLKPRSRGSKQ